MSNKLFVGSLPFQVTDEELGELFKEYGDVVSAKVIRDRDSGRSRGFGFVEMQDANCAQQAIESLDGSEFQGRSIKVNIAKERSDNRRSGGFNSRRY